MQKQRKRLLRILLTVFLVGAIFIGIRNQRDFWRSGADLVQQSTEIKLKRMNRWLPDETALVSVFDLRLLRADLFLSALLQKVMSQDAFTSNMLQPFLESTDIGMLAVIADYDEEQRPQAAAIMQGAFDQDQLKTMIETSASEEGSALERHEIGNAEIYFERGVAHPLAFAFLDSAHWAMGSYSLIVKLFSHTSSKPLFTQHGDALLLGRVLFVPKLQKILPHQFAQLHDAHFFSTKGKSVEAEIKCSSQEEVEALKLFLAGFKSLLLLQHEGDPIMTSALNSVTFFSEGTTFRMTADVTPLISLWGKQ